MPLAEPISQLLLDRSDPGLVRIAIGGLWVFTMFEFLLALFRLDERAKAFLVFTVANVLVTIPADRLAGRGRGRGAPRACCSASTRPARVFLAGPADRPAPPARADPRLRACCAG